MRTGTSLRRRWGEAFQVEKDQDESEGREFRLESSLAWPESMTRLWQVVGVRSIDVGSHHEGPGCSPHTQEYKLSQRD